MNLLRINAEDKVGEVEMICTNCGQEQKSDTYCANCGNKFEKVEVSNEETQEKITNITTDELNEKEASSNAITPVQNEQAEHGGKVSNPMMLYWYNFVHYLKHPSDVFQHGEEKFKFGLSLIILFALSFGITNYGIINNNSIQYLVAFLGVGSLFIVTVTLIISFSLFVISRLFGIKKTFKSIVGYYGTLLISPLLLVVVSFVLIVFQITYFGFGLLYITLFFVIYILPIYLITKLLRHKVSLIYSFFGVIAYLVLSTVLFALLSVIMAGVLLVFPILDGPVGIYSSSTIN